MDWENQLNKKCGNEKKKKKERILPDKVGNGEWNLLNKTNVCLEKGKVNTAVNFSPNEEWEKVFRGKRWMIENCTIDS